MYCANCGKSLLPQDNYCSACGLEVADSKDPIRSSGEMNGEKYYVVLSHADWDGFVDDWDLPQGTNPGKWCKSERQGGYIPLSTMKQLIRLSRVERLYRAEYRGPQFDLQKKIGKFIRLADDAITVNEARLHYRVRTWDRSAAYQFSANCTERALMQMDESLGSQVKQLVRQSIESARSLSSEAAVVYEHFGSDLLDNHFYAKHYSLKSDRTLPEHPTFEEIDDLRKKVYERSEKEVMEFKYLAEAAHNCIGLVWESNTFRAANKARTDDKFIKEILFENEKIKKVFTKEQLGDLLDPHKYLGKSVEQVENVVKYLKNKHKF